MKQDERAKFDLFLAAKYLRANAGGYVEEDEATQLSKLSAATGISVDGIKAQHSALVAEFRERTATLPTDARILVLDRAKDLSSRENLAQAILESIAPPNMARNLARLNGKEIPRDDLDRMSAVFGDMCVADESLQNFWDAKKEEGTCGTSWVKMEGILHGLSVIYPGKLALSFVDMFLGGIPAPSRAAMPAEAEWARLLLYHEAFGHGTECLGMNTNGQEGTGRANCELRADIAAIAGNCRDAKNIRAARAWIAMRDLAYVRTAGRTEYYIHAPLLRDALREIESRGAEFCKLDDAGLLGFINDTYEKLKWSDEGYARRRRTVCDARSLVSHADKSWAQEILGDMEKNHPKDFSEACAHIRDCVESLCHICEVEPHQAGISPCTLPAPSMRPQL